MWQFIRDKSMPDGIDHLHQFRDGGQRIRAGVIAGKYKSQVKFLHFVRAEGKGANAAKTGNVMRFEPGC